MRFPPLAHLTGPKKYAAAFFSGAVMALAMAPVGAFPVLLFCIPAFIILTRAATTRSRAFLVAWTFGSGYFIAGLYWISAALFVDIKQFGWVLPLSLVVGPALFALYYGVVPLITYKFKNDLTSYTLATVAALALVEWLRGHLFTGFPWNLIGYTWLHVLPVMQASAYVGIYGLTLLTLLWAALPVLGERKNLQYAVASSFLIVTLLGVARLALNPTQGSAHTVRIVQANIPESEKWHKDNDWRNLEKHALLSSSATPFTFVVWPETAVTADLTQFPEIADYIAKKMPPGAHAILGALRVTDEGRQFHNSVSILDPKGRVLQSYDKHHLVPFGEYIPFRAYLNLTPLALAVSGIGDFTKGEGPATLQAADGLPPFSSLICYEAIFPHEAVKKSARPAWIVNVTNDAWYGRTAGPFQHFETTRVRAVEQGLPLARAANTGISAMIDPLGRVIAKKSLGETGVVDATLPQALAPTVYARLGDIVFLLMAGLLFIFGWRKRAFQPPLPPHGGRGLG